MYPRERYLNFISRYLFSMILGGFIYSKVKTVIFVLARENYEEKQINLLGPLSLVTVLKYHHTV